jgi:hypothetical protein
MSLYLDCPQVQCIRSYSAKQTDELSLEETDVVNVRRKMKDGINYFEYNSYVKFIVLIIGNLTLNNRLV